MEKEELARINEDLGKVNNAVYEIEQLEALKGIVDKIADNEEQLKDDTTAKLYVDIFTRRNGIEKVGFFKYLDLDTIQLIKYALNKCIDNRITLNKKLIDETNYVKINK
jgi:hypothetical protein